MLAHTALRPAVGQAPWDFTAPTSVSAAAEVGSTGSGKENGGSYGRSLSQFIKFQSNDSSSIHPGLTLEQLNKMFEHLTKDPLYLFTAMDSKPSYQLEWQGLMKEDACFMEFVNMDQAVRQNDDLPGQSTTAASTSPNAAASGISSTSANVKTNSAESVDDSSSGASGHWWSMLLLAKGHAAPHSPPSGSRHSDSNAHAPNPNSPTSSSSASSVPASSTASSHAHAQSPSGTSWFRRPSHEAPTSKTPQHQHPQRHSIDKASADRSSRGQKAREFSQSTQQQQPASTPAETSTLKSLFRRQKSEVLQQEQQQQQRSHLFRRQGSEPLSQSKWWRMPKLFGGKSSGSSNGTQHAGSGRGVGLEKGAPTAAAAAGANSWGMGSLMSDEECLMAFLSLDVQ